MTVELVGSRRQYTSSALQDLVKAGWVEQVDQGAIGSRTTRTMSEITETKRYSGLWILISEACTIVAYLKTTYPPGGIVGGLLVLVFAAGTIVSLREAIRSYRNHQKTPP